MRTLFLHPPSYEGFDGGAGSRYQARREVRSFWYPTWLAQPAALVPDSRLVDAPPDGLTLEDVRPLARDYELAVLHTSTPSFPYDVRVAEALRAENPRLRIGFVGAHVAVRPEESLAASPAIDFVARNEFDFTIEEVARGHPLGRVLGRLGVTWSCNSKANVPPETLEVLKDNGLRLLLVGYESGNQGVLNSVKKGVRLDVARRFTRDARALGIRIHGTFVLGLPGETCETIEETIRFACELEPDTIQVSIAAPYPGTVMYRQALEHGWLDGRELVDGRGVQRSALSYPHLPHTEIFASVETFYRRFYFLPRQIFAIVGEMARDRQVLARRLRDGVEFLRFLAARRAGAASRA